MHVAAGRMGVQAAVTRGAARGAAVKAKAVKAGARVSAVLVAGKAAERVGTVEERRTGAWVVAVVGRVEVAREGRRLE